jgi:hypothetical protein
MSSSNRSSTSIMRDIHNRSDETSDDSSSVESYASASEKAQSPLYHLHAEALYGHLLATQNLLILVWSSPSGTAQILAVLLRLTGLAHPIRAHLLSFHWRLDFLQEAPMDKQMSKNGDGHPETRNPTPNRRLSCERHCCIVLASSRAPSPARPTRHRFRHVTPNPNCSVIITIISKIFWILERQALPKAWGTRCGDLQGRMTTTTVVLAPTDRAERIRWRSTQTNITRAIASGGGMKWLNASGNVMKACGLPTKGCTYQIMAQVVLFQPPATDAAKLRVLNVVVRDIWSRSRLS